MSGEKKCIRLQIDLPIDDACLLEKISSDQISNMRFRLSLKPLSEQNVSLSSYELCSVGSSSVSGYSSASDSLMLSGLSQDFKAKDCLPSEMSHAINIYDRLSYRKKLLQSENYDNTSRDVKNRVENIYEEIIYDDKCLNDTKQAKLTNYYHDSISTDDSKSKNLIKNLKKKYSQSQIMENLKQLTMSAQKQEERLLFEYSNLKCSDPIYV